MTTFAPVLLALLALGDVKDDARSFLESCQASKFEEAAARFAPKIAAALPPDKLRQVWAGLIAQLGPVLKTGEPREDRVGESRRVKIRCEFKAAALDALISFNPEGTIEGFFLRPADPAAATRVDPPYVDPGKVVERPVMVGAADWPLEGILSLPKGEDPAPVVILVHGSGPQDRDESIGPNAPFRDLARGLATRGVAVLRYDKRTHAHKARYAAPGSIDAVTVQDETIDDALAAVAVARKLPGIDPARVFVLGHSLGGMAAPTIARADGKLAGVILMAAASRTPAEFIKEQLDYIATLDPAEKDEAARKEAAALDDVLARMKAGAAKDDERVLGASVRYWNTMRDTRPAETLAALPNVPALILQGGRDYQTTEADFLPLQKAVEGRPRSEAIFYPDLNHLFHKGEGKAKPAEYQKAGFVDVRVVDDVAKWVQAIR